MSLALRAPGHLQCKNTTNRAICALNPCLRVPAPGFGAALSPYLQSASRSRSAAVVVYARKEDTDGKHEHDNGWAVERAVSCSEMHTGVAQVIDLATAAQIAHLTR